MATQRSHVTMVRTSCKYIFTNEYYWVQRYYVVLDVTKSLSPVTAFRPANNLYVPTYID